MSELGRANQMHVEHLHRRELRQRTARRQAAGAVFDLRFERDLQRAGQEAHELSRLRGFDLLFDDFRPFTALEPSILQERASKTACTADLGGCCLFSTVVFTDHHVPALLQTAQGWQRALLLECGKSAAAFTTGASSSGMCFTLEVWHGGQRTSRAKRTSDIVRRCHH